MSPADRRKYDAGGLLPEELVDKHAPKLEKAEQEHFKAHLDRLDYAYAWSRTDRPTTSVVGTPDFLIGCAVGLALEFKLFGRKLTAAQAEWRRKFEARGGQYYVVESYQEALEIVEVYD